MRAFSQDESLKSLCWFHIVMVLTSVDHLYFILIFQPLIYSCFGTNWDFTNARGEGLSFFYKET